MLTRDGRLGQRPKLCKPHEPKRPDGRTLPKEFDLPQYMDYSAGHWEGDTCVVKTAGGGEPAATPTFVICLNVDHGIEKRAQLSLRP